MTQQESLTLYSFSVLTASLIFSVGAQTFLKLGVDALGGVGRFTLEEVLRIAFEPRIQTGICLYGTGLYLWLVTLSKFKFSSANLFFSANHIVTLFIAMWVFQETIIPTRWAGGFFIAFGIYLTSRG